MMSRSKSVLVVEDHLHSATVLARLLGKWGYDVRIAENIAQARTAAAEAKFDLMLCDLGLPDGDGCDLMRELAELYGLKGIALTGYGMPEDVQRAQDAGFSAHVLKPILFEQLQSVIDQVGGESVSDSL